MANGIATPSPARPRAQGAPLRKSLPLLLAGMAIVAALTAWALVAGQRQHRESQASRIESIANLRAGQVASWLNDNLERARFASESPLGELYLRWQQASDAAVLEQLTTRLDGFHKASGGHSVLVMTDGGEVAAGTSTARREAPPELQAAARRSLETGRPQFTPPYGSDGRDPAPRIDVVAPFSRAGRATGGLLVLRLDPKQSLFPALAAWPGQSRTGSSLLVRREGDNLVGANGRLRLPLSMPRLLAAVVIRGDAPLGQALDGQDFRGQPVLGVVQKVAGTEWYIVSKVDSDEAYAEARRGAAWTLAAGTVALLALGAGIYWLRSRQALRLAQEDAARQELLMQVREAHAEDLEQQVRQRTASLERTVQDLEAFGYSISHDLRGPLRTVSGFATVLARDEGAKLSEDGRRRLGRILAGVNTMNQMIEDILKCSRAERVEMQFELVDLQRLARKAAADLEPLFPQAQVGIGTLPAVQADPTLAGQVFANLIGNALKFSAHAERPAVEVGIHQAAGGPEVFVRDNGVGFDPAQAGKLFTPFHRLHGERQFTGTGIGLSIVKRLAERHGGHVRAESAPGGPTTFYFTLWPSGGGVPPDNAAH